MTLRASVDRSAAPWDAVDITYGKPSKKSRMLTKLVNHLNYGASFTVEGWREGPAWRGSYQGRLGGMSHTVPAVPLTEAARLAIELEEILRSTGGRAGQPWQTIEHMLLALLAISLDAGRRSEAVRVDAFPIRQVAEVLRRTPIEVCQAILGTQDRASDMFPSDFSRAASENGAFAAKSNDVLVSAARAAGLSEVDFPDFYTEFLVASEAIAKQSLFSDAALGQSAVACAEAEDEKPVRHGSKLASARLGRALELRHGGATLKEIGADLGVTRERARQILAKGGAPSAAAVRAMKDSARDAALQAVRDEYVAFLQRRPLMTVSEAAEVLGVERSCFVGRMDAQLRRMVLPDPKRSSSKWSSDTVVAALVAAATLEYPLTTNGYAQLRMDRLIHGPSVPRITQIYGTWAAACKAAGVEAGKGKRASYNSKWTDDDLVDAVRCYVVGAGGGTASGYSRWAETQDDRPSSSTVRNRLGHWNDILRRVHQTTYSESDQSDD